MFWHYFVCHIDNELHNPNVRVSNGLSFDVDTKWYICRMHLNLDKMKFIKLIQIRVLCSGILLQFCPLITFWNYLYSRNYVQSKSSYPRKYFKIAANVGFPFCWSSFFFFTILHCCTLYIMNICTIEFNRVLKCRTWNKE